MQFKNDVLFLAGFPRSGTTWFSNLINSHNSIVYRHELIGRNYEAFGEELFNKIKYDNGLSEDDYQKAINIVRRADIDTDKPPFFKKDFGLSNYPKVHHFSWLVAKAAPPFRPFYNKLFKFPSKRNDLKLLLKETRSLVDMMSMLKGLRVNGKIFLIRMPHGSIASHFSGIKQGKMPVVTKSSKLDLFELHGDNPYIQNLNYSKTEIENLSEAAYFSIQWCIYHIELLNIHKEFPDAILCFYEDFVNNTVEKTKELMAKLNLEYTSTVESFIQESSGAAKKTNSLLKDSGSDFYSVYRSDSFKADAWRDKLTEDDIETIDKFTMELYEQLRQQG